MRLTLPALAVSLALVAAARADNWPCFRGPSHQGISIDSGLPLSWTAEEMVAWKAAVPGEAWSSPIIWGRKVFLTTATDNGASCRVLAFDRDSGKLVWDREVFRQVPGHKQERNTYATPTPCTDG